MRHFRKFIALLAISALIAPAGAFAQVSQDAYDNEGPRIQDRIDQSGPSDDSSNGGNPTTPTAAEANDEGGELPFTGLELALIVLGGIAALLLGLALRRVTRARPIA